MSEPKKPYPKSFTDKVADRVAKRMGLAKSVVRGVIIATWQEAANQIKEDNGGNIPHIARFSPRYRRPYMVHDPIRKTYRLAPAKFVVTVKAVKELREHFLGIDTESDHGIVIKQEIAKAIQPGTKAEFWKRVNDRKEEAMKAVFDQMSRADKEAFDALMKQMSKDRAEKNRAKRKAEWEAKQAADQSSQSGS